MSRKNVRVIIPRNPDEFIELAERIVTKHNEDPVNSLLSGLDMADFEAKVLAAKASNASAKQLRKDAETATEDRDHILGRKKDQSSSTEGTVLNFVTRARDILLGYHKGKEQHLGDFGFDVNQSVASAKGDEPTTPTSPTAPAA